MRPATDLADPWTSAGSLLAYKHHDDVRRRGVADELAVLAQDRGVD